MNDKLKQTLERILALEDDFKLEMGSFETVNSCGTSYCIAGILAAKDNYPKQFISDVTGKIEYIRYSYDLVNGSDDIWDFLFSIQWPNCLAHAKKRAQYVLDNGDAPEDFNFKWDIKEGGSNV